MTPISASVIGFAAWCLRVLIVLLALVGVGLIFLLPPDSLNTALVYARF